MNNILNKILLFFLLIFFTKQSFCYNKDLVPLWFTAISPCIICTVGATLNSKFKKLLFKKCISPLTFITIMAQNRGFIKIPTFKFDTKV